MPRRTPVSPPIADGSAPLAERLREAQARARAVEERYALATTALLEGIYEWDVAAGRLFLTERARQFFAMPDENLTPADWNGRIHPDDFPSYRAAIAEHFRGRAALLEHEYRIVAAGQDYRWVLDRGIGLRDAGGRVVKLVGALTDITARKAGEIELRRARDDAERALEQQVAISDVLRVMSTSPTDAQPVFDVIAQRAVRLCDANLAVISRFDGSRIHLAAVEGVVPEAVEIVRSFYPMEVGAETVTSQTVREAAVVHVPDMLQDSRAIKRFALAAHYRGALGVPMTRDGRVLGVIFVGRAEPGLFSPPEVELLKTFADQAAIAIDHVRLFREAETRNVHLTEALEQQTATSEILRVISRSPTDTQPVFDTIAEAAMKLCRATVSTVLRFDGSLVHMAAIANAHPAGAAALRRAFPRPASRDTAGSRAIMTRKVVVIEDIADDGDFRTGEAAMAAGFRSVLAVPLMLDRNPIGAITVGRPEPGTFPEGQVALLETFADQAVIAIENVRLFTELQVRTRELTRSVEELKALGDVGQAVSSTLDLETVLSTIVSRATGLAGVDGGSIWEYDEGREEFHLHATDRLPRELVDAFRAMPIRKGEGALGQLGISGDPVEIEDVVRAESYQSRVRETLLRFGLHSILAVPMLREKRLLGALAVNRKAAGRFPPAVVGLLRTFATQSALAIQNARLYREIEHKSRELEVASRHKSEFLANMSHELRTPLNAILGFSEVLAERIFGDINDKQAEYLNDILDSGRHLLSLINDILDLSKIEAGRMDLELSQFDLPRAIDNALILVRERATRHSISLAEHVDQRLGSICADERKMKQVLLNLLSNALKFTAEGGRVEVRASLVDGAAEIAVSDTGVGIAADDLAIVFEEFRQVGAAGKKVEGTGLGLAITRKIIELHGGSIRVESKLGVGSTFAFTLPLAPVRPAMTTSAP